MISPEDRVNLEKTQHSGMLPIEQGGERPYIEFDNTPLEHAFNEGKLSSLPENTEPLVNEGSEAHTSSSIEEDSKETPWHKKTATKVGAVVLVVAAGVATAAGLMLPKADHTSTEPVKTPKATSEPSTSQDTTSSPEASSTPETPKFISPAELQAMPLDEFDKLQRSQELVFLWDRLGQSDAQSGFYTYKGSYELSKYNPSFIASIDNTDNQVVNEVWYSQQTALLQCSPADIGPTGACTTTNLDLDAAQKAANGAFYNPKPIEGILNGLGVADHSQFVKLGYHFSTENKDTVSPVQETTNQAGEKIQYKDIPFIEEDADGSTYHKVMRAIWTPITVQTYKMGQPNGFKKAGLWQQYQIIDPSQKFDNTAF